MILELFEAVVMSRRLVFAHWKKIIFFLRCGLWNITEENVITKHIEEVGLEEIEGSEVFESNLCLADELLFYLNDFDDSDDELYDTEDDNISQI